MSVELGTYSDWESIITVLNFHALPRNFVANRMESGHIEHLRHLGMQEPLLELEQKAQECHQRVSRAVVLCRCLS